MSKPERPEIVTRCNCGAEGRCYCRVWLAVFAIALSVSVTVLAITLATT